jgi:ATP-dependent RNA helicase RhlE
MLFEDLSLSKSIQKPYLSCNLYPTPIQEQSIPIVLSGRDLIGCAQTGKKQVHLPYQLFINYTELLVLQRKQNKFCALVVTPTRELAVQITKF